ncbi:MAG: CoA transferase [Thermomicrobiales bacterium]|nr:CoA transferase [Thermomicrobiales bacterium]
MTNTQPGTGPLAGIRVVDLTRVMTGPYCTMMLGDLGADVIKIERPDLGDDTRHWGPPFIEGESSYFMSINRNKRSVELDLKSELGQEVLWKLIDRADVVVENFAPGVIDRLGFGHKDVLARNPGVIYASISGFGQTGPSRNRTAYDLIVNGMSGMASVTGFRDGPPVKFGPPIADIAAGMFTATAIIAALYERERDPEHTGQYLDTSMLGGQISMLTYLAEVYFNTGKVPLRNGNRHSIITPYDTFPTADGYVNIAVGNDAIWQRFCVAMGMIEAATDSRYTTNADRLANVEPLYETIHEAMGTMTTAEIVEKLDAAAVPCGPINTIGEILEDPQVADQELRVTVPHARLGEVEVAGFPYKFRKTPLEMRSGPPVLGEHTAEVLRELGYEV